MPLYVNYTKHKSWDAKTEKFSSPEAHDQADMLGKQLMTLGISEISDKTIDELLIRQLILDKLYGSPMFKLNGKACTLKELRQMFQQNIGLFNQGRWSRDETRWKFVSRHAKGMMHDVEHQVTKKD
jgi:hypothetical protein